MKIAILSDIHGNSLALDAVLADIEASGGVDEYWLLGDLVALGIDPAGVLKRLAALQNATFIRGNTDRWVITGEHPPQHTLDSGSDPEKIRWFAEVAGMFGWAQGAVVASGGWDWLAQLPLDFERTLPDGTQCHCVHARPGSDEGLGIGQDTTDAEVAQRLAGCAADLVCVGHTHQPLHRQVGRWEVLNPGSVGMPPLAQANYAIIEASAEGHQIELRQAAYDREQVIAQAQAINYPGLDFLTKRMREQ